MSEEEWRPVPGYEGFYEVSSTGRIRSVERVITYTVRKPSVILKQFPDTKGYPRVLLAKNGKTLNASTHVLVCSAFHGPRPEGMEAAHNDGDAANPAAANLRWATKVDNAADRKKHGSHMHGEIHGMAKLSEDDVREIRSAPSSRGLTTKFGVAKSTIKDIRSGKRWKHLL